MQLSCLCLQNRGPRVCLSNATSHKKMQALKSDITLCTSNFESVLPFYNISNYELVNTILFQSQSTRNDKFCNNSFYNALKCNVTSNIMEQLSFKYYTDDEFNDVFNNTHNKIKLSIFHLNIRSLNKNYHELYCFLQSLNIEFDVLVSSEIWLTNLELFSNIFAGYTFYYDAPCLSTVGGVGVFVKNDYSCTVIDNLKISTSNCNKVENIWIKISKDKLKFIIGAIYRHPNHNIHEFATMLESNLCSISKHVINTAGRPKCCRKRREF